MERVITNEMTKLLIFLGVGVAALTTLIAARIAKTKGSFRPYARPTLLYLLVALLFFGEREIRLGRIDTAQFFAFLFFLGRSYDPMRKLARLHNAFSQGLGAAQHVWEVMDEHAEINEKPNPIDLAPLQNEIEFREVRFGYGDESRAVLRKLRDNFAQSILIVPGDPEHAIAGGQKAVQIRCMHTSPATASDQRDRLPFPRQWRRNASLRLSPLQKVFRRDDVDDLSRIAALPQIGADLA